MVLNSSALLIDRVCCTDQQQIYFQNVVEEVRNAAVRVILENVAVFHTHHIILLPLSRRLAVGAGREWYKS